MEEEVEPKEKKILLSLAKQKRLLPEAEKISAAIALGLPLHRINCTNPRAMKRDLKAFQFLYGMKEWRYAMRMKVYIDPIRPESNQLVILFGHQAGKGFSKSNSALAFVGTEYAKPMTVPEMKAYGLTSLDRQTRFLNHHLLNHTEVSEMASSITSHIVEITPEYVTFTPKAETISRQSPLSQIPQPITANSIPTLEPRRSALGSIFDSNSEPEESDEDFSFS